MYNASLNHLLMAALTLGLSACGGSGDGDDSASAGTGKISTPATGPKLSAITIPYWTSFPITVVKDSEGKDVLRVIREKPERYPPKTMAYSEVLKAKVWRPAPTHYLGFLDNRFGILCRQNSETKIVLSVQRKDGGSGDFHSPRYIGKYIFVSDELVEVDYHELFGRVYKSVDDCEIDEDFWGIDPNGYGYSFKEKVGKDLKTTTLLDQPRPHRPELDTNPQELEKAFSNAGYEGFLGAEARLIRAKAYKYTAGGKTTYVFFGMDSPKHPVSADAQSVPLSTTIHISQ